MLKLPQPFRKQGQQLCSDGNTAVFFDAYNVDHMHDAYQQGLAEQPVQVNAMLVEALEAAEKLEHEALVALSEATDELKVGNTYTTATDTYKAHNDLIHRLDKILNSQYRDRKRTALTAAKQAQPVCGYDDKTGNCTRVNCCKQAQPEQPSKYGSPELQALILDKLQQAQPERVPLGADMFWDHEDPETFGYDIETIASNYGLGDEIEIDCAKRMPGIKVRVIQSEPEGELTWERIDFQEAAHGIKQGGQP